MDLFCVWDFLVENIVLAAASVANTLPVHYNMDTGAQLAALLLQLIYTFRLITATVDLKNVLNALIFLLGMEGIRLLLVAARYIKSLIPVIG